MMTSRLNRRGFLVSAAAGAAFSQLNSRAAEGRAGDVAWLDEVQRPPRELPDDAPVLSPLLMDNAGQPITTLAGWQAKREQIRRWWLEFLGPLRVDEALEGPPRHRVLDEDRVDGVVRQLIEYETEPGIAIEAYLLRPAEIQRPCPGVVVLHSTVSHTIRQPAGVEGSPEKAFGLHLARQGFVAICPRCFLWTKDLSISYQQHVRAFQARHPAARGMAKMLHDARVSVDLLAALPEVDANRIGAVGHSLGAKEVLYLAALDDRIRATVSSEGGIGTRFSNWDASWYLGPAIRQDGFTREHHELLALAAPRAFLLIGGDSADGDRSWPFIASALEVYRLYGNKPRLGLFNHRQGHAVPPEAERRIAEWTAAYV
jgi:dienelactone hydrolase